MGTIGEYVHYREKQYRQFGIGRSKPRGLSYNKAYSQAKEDLSFLVGQTNLKKLNIKSIEKAMQSTRNRLSQWKKNPSALDVYDEYFIKAVEAHFLQKGQKINLETMTPETLGSLLEEEKMRYNKQHDGKPPYFTQQTILKFGQTVTKLYDKLAELQREGLMDVATASDIEKRVIDCQNELARVLSSLSSPTKIPVASIEYIFQNYNQIIGEYSKPLPKDIGDLGEVFAMYAAARAAGKIDDELYDLIDQFLISPTSQRRSSTTYKLIGLKEKTDVYKEIFSNFSVQQRNGSYVLVTPGAAQDTIDIEVDYENKGTLLASVKNIRTISKPIHILNGAPVTSLFNLVNSDFVNHYMNLLAFQKNFDSDLQKADEIFSKAVAVRALAGARAKADTRLANSLIISDRSSGKVHIFSVESLLNNLLKARDIVQKGLLINLSEGKSFADIKVKNTWAGSKTKKSYELAAKERIPNLFANIHSVKITASLLPSALKGS